MTVVGKNNLGHTALPTLGFTIDSFPVETEDGDAAWTGRLVWGEDSTVSIADAMRRAAESPDEKSAASEAADWLEDYLRFSGGIAGLAYIKRAGAAAGNSYDSLKRARRKIGAENENSGFPRRTYWRHPSEIKRESPVGAQSGQDPRGESSTALTALTGAQSEQSGQSGQSEESSAEVAPTDEHGSDGER